MRILSRGALEIVVDLAQRAYAKGVCTPNPPKGALVFEPTLLWCRGPRVGRVGADVDAIGWLVDSGLAPVWTDTQMRERQLAGLDPLEPDVRMVWDIIPLSGRRGAMGKVLRWENAEFWALPADIAELVGG